MNVYALSFSALKNNPTTMEWRNMVGYGRANNEEQAREDAMTLWLSSVKVEDGWHDHCVNVMLIPHT